MDGIIHDSRPGFSILPTRSEVPSCCWSMAHGLASCLPHWSVVRFRGMARFGTLSNQWSQWAVEIEASWMTSMSAPGSPRSLQWPPNVGPQNGFCLSDTPVCDQSQPAIPNSIQRMGYFQPHNHFFGCLAVSTESTDVALTEQEQTPPHEMPAKSP